MPRSSVKMQTSRTQDPSPIAILNQFTMVQLTIDNANECQRSKATFRAANAQRPKTKGPSPARLFHVFQLSHLSHAFQMFEMFPRTRDARKKTEHAQLQKPARQQGLTFKFGIRNSESGISASRDSKPRGVSTVSAVSGDSSASRVSTVSDADTTPKK